MINDLALILIVASTVTLLFKKLKQPLVLGYIMAGFIVSPHMPYTMSVMDTVDIKTWADIGVMFLLFSLGLDFSFKGLPCPNIFAGGCNFHGPHEFVSVQVMEKAMQVIIKICELTAHYND